MASKEEVFNSSAHREVLGSFSLSDTERSVEQNLHQACAHHKSLMHQQVVVEDALEMAWVLDAKRQSIEQIIQEQAHRAQVGYFLSNAAPGFGEVGGPRKRVVES